MRTLLLSLGLLVAGSAGAQRAPEVGRVVGTVTDAETGEPLVGANVWLVDTAVGAATRLGGRFVIENVPEGAYAVRAAYVGYAFEDLGVTVRAGETVALTLSLRADLLCECVIVCAAPEPVSRGVYQARVVRYVGWESDCCVAREVRRAVPVARWEAR